jgi:hypothetical protein
MPVGPKNDNSVPGVWGDPSQRAPGHGDTEVTTALDAELDPAAAPTDAAIQTAAAGQPSALPYPEATYWAKLNGGGFGASVRVLSDNAGLPLVMADGSMILI